MVFKSIKTRIYACMAVWIVILSAAHLAIHYIGPESEDWRTFAIETLAAITPLLFFARYFYTHIVRPVEELSGMLKNVTLGLQPEQLRVKHNDEIGLLTREFNTMIHALYQRDLLFKGIDERLKAQNRELYAINERLTAADKVKTQFLASVTHELKTPLSTITGYSEMMLEGVGGELNAMQRDFVEEIAASTHHLNQLVNDVLDFSKAAGGTMELKFEEFDISKLINEIEINLHPLLRKKGQSFEVSLASDLNNVVADRLRIKQVLLNLLSNAIKFTPDAGRISVGSFRRDGHWGIVVTDNGIGIKEEDFSKVFEPFSQVDSSYTRKFEGTGLGLAICQRIVGMHGGTIWVESEPGKGSSFYFTIPDNLNVDINAGKDI
ncbi:MAG: HAMP domain-containing sensor histidine kinase [Deltaproteobacteria bacterium]